MRVEERNVSEQLAGTANRASESQRVQVNPGSSGPVASPGGDSVGLSSLAGRISQSLNTLAGQSAQRVVELQKQYRAGSYQPSAQGISRALIAQSQGAAA